MTSWKSYVVHLCLIAVLAAVPVWAQEAPPRFTNLVAVGDSLTAGFQNNSLNLKGQNNSYPALIARQLHTFHFLPLISEPGMPNELVLVSPGMPPVIDVAPGPQGTRVFPLAIPQNLAVPGQDVMDALTVRPNLPLDSIEDAILGVPTLLIPQLGIPPLSQIEMAYAMSPTFTLFWLGNNDVLGAALACDPALITPLEVFQPAFQTALGTVLASGSKVIAANIPDVTTIPFLSSAEEVAALVGAPLEMIGPALGIASGDMVAATAVPMVGAILSGSAEGPLPGHMVLTAAEGQAIRTAIVTMNYVISQVCAALHVPLVDVYSTMREIDQSGLKVGDFHLTSGFLGGVFSLDGVHPTNTGYAVIANLFIDKLSMTYGINVPNVDVAAVATADPLVLKMYGAAEAGSDQVMVMEPGYFESLKRNVFPSRLRKETKGDFDEGVDPQLATGREPLQRDLQSFQIRIPKAAKIKPGPIGVGYAVALPSGGHSEKGRISK